MNAYKCIQIFNDVKKKNYSSKDFIKKKICQFKLKLIRLDKDKTTRRCKVERSVMC